MPTSDVSDLYDPEEILNNREKEAEFYKRTRLLYSDAIAFKTIRFGKEDFWGSFLKKRYH